MTPNAPERPMRERKWRGEIAAAFDALQEAVDNGNRLRMSIPARPDADHDLLISEGLGAGLAALDALTAAEQDKTEALRQLAAMDELASRLRDDANEELARADAAEQRAQAAEADMKRMNFLANLGTFHAARWQTPTEIWTTLEQDGFGPISEGADLRAAIDAAARPEGDDA